MQIPEDHIISRLRTTINQIISVAGNLPDSALDSKTGPNDAVDRGLKVIRARDLAKIALKLLESLEFRDR